MRNLSFNESKKPEGNSSLFSKQFTLTDQKAKQVKMSIKSDFISSKNMTKTEKVFIALDIIKKTRKTRCDCKSTNQLNFRFAPFFPLRGSNFLILIVKYERETVKSFRNIVNTYFLFNLEKGCNNLFMIYFLYIFYYLHQRVAHIPFS